MAKVSIGRSRLPPEAIRWLAISGIIVTSDPVRDRIVALTRPRSGATSSMSRPIEGADGLSKGTTTANRVLRNRGTGKHRNAMVSRQVRRCRGGRAPVDARWLDE